MPTPQPTPRPFVGLVMGCCNVYTRLYQTAAGDAYAGHCPKCGRPVRVPISPQGGQPGRFFSTG